jgi:hypothetical protein
MHRPVDDFCPQRLPRDEDPTSKDHALARLRLDAGFVTLR